MKKILLTIVFMMLAINVLGEDIKILKAINLDNKYSLELKDNYVVEDNMGLNFDFSNDIINIIIKNDSKDNVTIYWNDSYYIGYDDKKFVLHDPKKSRTLVTQKEYTNVLPGEEASKVVVPATNFGIIAGDGLDSEVAWINKSLFSEYKKRDVFDLELDIKIGDIKSKYLFTFGENGEFEQGVVKSEINDILETTRDENNKITENQLDKLEDQLEDLKNENESLKQEIEERDRLLKEIEEYLKKQN